MEPISTLLRSPATTLTGPIIVAILILIFWLRAGSIYALLERFWRFTAGKSEISDPVLKEFSVETKDLERFIFMYRIKVNTTYEMHRFLSWLKTHQIGIGQAQRASRWIDPSTSEIIKHPPKRHAIHLGSTLFFSTILAFAIGNLALTSSTLLQVKASKAWFATDGQSAWYHADYFKFEDIDCSGLKQPSAPPSKLSEQDSNLICQLLKNGSLKTIADRSVHQQRALSALWGPLAFFWFLFSVVGINSLHAAKAIRIKISSQITSESSKPADEETKPKTPRKRRRNTGAPKVPPTDTGTDTGNPQ